MDLRIGRDKDELSIGWFEQRICEAGDDARVRVQTSGAGDDVRDDARSNV